MIPLDIFSDKLENVKNLVDAYSNMPYRPKTVAGAAAAAATS
jgi:hypothetical protein